MAQNPSSNLNNTLLNILSVLTCEDNNSNLHDCRESTSCAITEMALVYGQRVPYTKVPNIQGNCVKFTDDFIYLVRYAMATDCLLYMSPDEREVWDQFAAYQDTGYANMLEAVEALDSHLVDLVNCVDPLAGCQGSCDGGYLVKVEGDNCPLEIIPPEGR